MKKFASLVAAGALLLTTATAAFAFYPSFGGVKQFSFTSSNTQASSSSGSNSQFGKGTQTMHTGASDASALSLTAGNVNVGGHHVTQGAMTTSNTEAGSSSGSNKQTNFGWFHSGSQSMTTGGSSAEAGSATVSNVNFSF